MVPDIDASVTEYYNHMCKAWGYTSDSASASGYESVIDRLKILCPDSWAIANDLDKTHIENEIFEIYRAINIIPITYYSMQGCIDEIKSINSKIPKLSNNILKANNIGQSLCRFWFPNMQSAYTYHDKQIGIGDRFYNDVKLKRAISICLKYKRTVLPPDLRSALSLVGGNMIQNFKPMHARAIYEYICPIFQGKLLDFSSGYGGRMLGAMTSNLKFQYTGIEPNTETYTALSALGSIISSVNGNKYSVLNSVSEEVQLEPNSYDAAFSSPPYFNLEIYCDEPTQCMYRYKDIDRWFEFYVEPTLKMLHTSLGNYGIYAVNIADYAIEKNQFKIVDRWLELSRKLKFEHVDTLYMPLQSRPGSKNTVNAKKMESIFVFKKT